MRQVSIQPLFRWNLNSGIVSGNLVMFQYNHCFGGTKTFQGLYNLQVCVSIQPLFRWNREEIMNNEKITKFQYNHCFGGTLFCIPFYYTNNRFQYNHCFGGTYDGQKFNVYINKFQYNHCFGGTKQNTKSYKPFVKGFNTTIVSVEPIAIVGVIYVLKFQYNHCFGGTNLVELISNIFNEFQYNHCFGGTGIVLLLITKMIRVSIQPLFRWNICFKQ